MNEAGIQNLADDLHTARTKEFELRQAATAARAAATREASLAIAQGYAAGVIGGKNADERKYAEDRFLASKPAIGNLEAEAAKAEALAAGASIDRQYHEDVLSLTKAWLYSQGVRL
jgi:hypothetical protein